MSTLHILGSIGIGAVMGWLMGLLEPKQLNFRQVIAVLFSNGLVLLEVAWLVGWQAALVALGSGLTMFFIHRIWRSELRRR
jgi:hypothetical protein